MEAEEKTFAQLFIMHNIRTIDALLSYFMLDGFKDQDKSFQPEKNINPKELNLWSITALLNSYAFILFWFLYKFLKC